MKNMLKKVVSNLLCGICFLNFSVPTVLAATNLEDKQTAYNATVPAGEATTKPVMTVTKKVFETAEAAKGQTVKVEISVENATAKYCTTAFHVNWDNRLEVVKDVFGDPSVESGAALKKLAPTIVANGTNTNGIFVSTMGTGDYGVDGVMWTIELKVPDDAKAGDVFPIDVYYQHDGDKGDLFTDNKNTDAGLLMQSWFFHNGINSAGNPSTDPYLVKADATFADGYIAIENNEPQYKDEFELNLYPGFSNRYDTVSDIVSVTSTNPSAFIYEISDDSRHIYITGISPGTSDIVVTLANKDSYIIHLTVAGFTTTTTSSTTTTTTTTTIPEINIIAGDANNDGVVNLADVVLLRKYIVGGYSVSVDMLYGDVNKDGAINIADVVLTRRIIVGGYN